LPHHRLAFTRRSTARNCGVADAVADEIRSVWGAIYAIRDDEMHSLDRSEGFQSGRAKNSYVRSACEVFLDGNWDRPMTVEVYFETRQAEPPLPSQDYKDRILTGANACGLPEEYIRLV
jgi:gamma-glutamylcyclotransferase (GGCT)/AIG2-like uncharacterized protein YtfP